MILHSIVSLSDIFYNSGTDVQAAAPVYKRIDGGLLEIRNGSVNRLISTDPRLYLDQRYQPYAQYKDSTNLAVDCSIGCNKTLEFP